MITCKAVAADEDVRKALAEILLEIISGKIGVFSLSAQTQTPNEAI